MDLIDRQAAIDALIWKIRPHNNGDGTITMCVMSEELVRKTLDDLPSAQPEIIRCKDCMYGKQDDDGWWSCISFGCQVGNEDGSGFCADAERRTDD